MHSNPVFDRLYADAVPALLAGDHRQDEPPVDGGRWPVSMVGIPDEPAREVLAAVMREALAFAGPGHFETGRMDGSHLTVRALEPYREAAAPEDPVTAEWVAALEEVGRECPPVRLRLTGVTLTSSAVMVQAEPVGDEPWGLMRRLRAALGPLAWFEDQWRPRHLVRQRPALRSTCPRCPGAGRMGGRAQGVPRARRGARRADPDAVPLQRGQRTAAHGHGAVAQRRPGRLSGRRSPVRPATVHASVRLGPRPSPTGKHVTQHGAMRLEHVRR